MKVAANSAWQKSCFTAMKHLESGLRIDRRSKKYQSFELIYNGLYDGNDFVEDYDEMLFRESFTSAAARVNTTHCTLKPSRWKIAVLPQLNTTQTLVAILNFSNCFPYFFHHLDKLMMFSHNKFIPTIKYSRSSKPVQFIYVRVIFWGNPRSGRWIDQVRTTKQPETRWKFIRRNLF